MVKIELVKNKKGEILKTKEGVELKEYKFEKGDLFIPCNNSIIIRENKAEIEGKTKTISNYKLKCVVKDFQDEQEIFVSLTPSQAKTLLKKIESGILINQNLFIAYTYFDKDKNEWVGIGIKGKDVPRKSFDDFKEELKSSENYINEEN